MLRVLHLAGKGSCLPGLKALQGSGVTVNQGCTCLFGVALKGRETRHPPELAQSERCLTPAVSQKISAVRPCAASSQRLSLNPPSLCNLSHGAHSHAGSATHFFPQTHALLLRILEWLPCKTSAHATLRFLFFPF